MLIAWICMNVIAGKEFDVFNILKRIPGIKEVFVLYGIYDIILKVEVDKLADLQPLVFGKLSNIPFLKTTVTMIAK
ncbi:MAG: Lrp/AsnC ligand binding domain-containing protein [Promethearchaeota archaeon]